MYATDHSHGLRKWATDNTDNTDIGLNKLRDIARSG